MQTLSRDLRRELERTVKQARRVAETGARKAIERLGVGDAKPPAGLSPAGQSLRDRLRAHGRQLGDRREARTGKQVTIRLVAECAYENWHRMLFARFLAENDLLIEPTHGLAISIGDCKELARSQSEDWLTLASSYAVRMLPQIFRPGDPVLDVSLPPETRSELEDLLKSLPAEVFQAGDSLGWVYQFWQAERKDEVNASETKIGANELPAVTQLFTEDYMVLFLLHNTLGAWWAGKVLAARPELAASAASEDELRTACAVGDVVWAYLRFVRDGDGPWRSAAGTFDEWPKSARVITVLDPCMGSGHFLVFALPILVAIRMEEEGLTRASAVDAVLRDNLFGLEIDPRCTQIAAFNLALAAWRMAGYRSLPPLQLACSGLSLGVTKEEWLSLAERISPLPPDKDLFGTTHNLFSQQVQGGLEVLFDLFEKGPWLGSLIDPRRAGSSLLEAGYKQIQPLLAPLLATQASAEISEMAVTAQGLSTAAELLAQQFTIVITNVPYLGRGKQDDTLKEHLESRYPEGKADLAAAFIQRCLEFCSSAGTCALVTPQNWLFLTTYTKLRTDLLARRTWNLVARLGPGAFETIGGHVVNVALLTLTAAMPSETSTMVGIDVSAPNEPEAKAAVLRGESTATACVTRITQADQRKNPGSVVKLEMFGATELLGTYASCLAGILNGDSPKFRRYFWEFAEVPSEWVFQQTTVDRTIPYGGRTGVIFFDEENGHLREDATVRRERLHDSDRRGNAAWDKWGVGVSQMHELPVTIYSGAKFDASIAVIFPQDQSLVLPIWAFCSSDSFQREVRRVNQKVSVENGYFEKLPFDLSHWRSVASEKYPDGLPQPCTDDPTQWLFNGHPVRSEHPLHVAVARLLGHKWPRQTGSSFMGCPALESDDLDSRADADGIVCLASIKGEPAAADRVNALLSAAFGSEWSAGKLDSFLAAVDFAGKSLDMWLRDGFFESHCDVFQQRPFIWHIWDGRQDGFHAFVNYHRLSAPNGEGRRTLEKLIYSYLGDWIVRQRNEQANGVDGADARLVAAEHLKNELKKIVAGEAPYDIFVRWKPLHEQSIGWEPDINDGVRINIRPFVTARTLGARAKNASILRVTPRIKWDKDRGKEPDRPKDEYPWFWGWDEQTHDFMGGPKFDGNRWNGLHYSYAAKQAARERAAAEAETEEQEA
jgi:Eco57I restriction-modification methylase